MQSLEPLTLTDNNTVTVDYQSNNTPTAGVLLDNASGYYLVIQYAGNTFWLKPWTTDFFQVNNIYAAQVVVITTTQSSSPTTTPLLYATLFTTNDPPPQGQYPITSFPNEVNITTSGDITISGTVDIGNSPTVDIGNSPTVTLGSGSTVDIGNTPTVSLGPGSTVDIGNVTGNVSVINPSVGTPLTTRTLSIGTDVLAGGNYINWAQTNSYTGQALSAAGSAQQLFVLALVAFSSGISSKLPDTLTLSSPTISGISSVTVQSPLSQTVSQSNTHNGTTYSSTPAIWLIAGLSTNTSTVGLTAVITSANGNLTYMTPVWLFLGATTSTPYSNFTASGLVWMDGSYTTSDAVGNANLPSLCSVIGVFVGAVAGNYASDNIVPQSLTSGAFAATSHSEYFTSMGSTPWAALFYEVNTAGATAPGVSWTEPYSWDTSMFNGAQWVGAPQ